MSNNFVNKSDKKTAIKNILSQKKEKSAKELREFYPVTYGQEALFFIDSYRNDAAYNVSSTIHLQGHLNVEALKKSIECIIKRHAVFRTIFLNIDGAVYQKISDEIDTPLEYYNFLNLINADELISDIITAADNKLFDLNKLPLVRFVLIQKSDDTFLLHFVAHHIVWDGWSGNIFIQELAEIYNAFCSGREADLPPLNFRYVDFAINQKQKFSSIIEHQQDYWKGKLSGYHGYLNLPDRSINQLNETGIIHNFKITDHLHNKISQLAKDNNTSLYSVLVANFYLLMYWMTGQKDICFGQPINIRDGGDYDKLIGYFVNVIPLRIEQNAQDTISALLANIKSTLREGFQNKDVPFEQIVNLLNPQRKDDVNPIFQSIISLTNLSQNEAIMNGLNLQVEESGKSVSKVDLTLGFILSSNGLSATFECNPARFNVETIKFLANLYCELCENFCSEPQQSIGELLASGCNSENIWLNKTNENEYPWWFRGMNNKDVTVTRKSFVDTLRSSDVEELARLIGVASESIIFTMYALLINFLNGKKAIGHASIKSDCEDVSIVNFQFATLDFDKNIQGLIKQYERYIASVRNKNIYKIPQIISANQSVCRGSAFYFSNYEGAFSGNDVINELLIVKCEKSNSQYRISLNISLDHFYPLSIQQIEGYWRTIIEKCLALDDSISPTFIGDEEKQKLLIDWNNTTVDYPKDKCIHELFETQVENNPDAVAVIFESEQLTYGELNQKANQLAHYLINVKQVKPDTLVGICIERSLEMVVGILGILKAGGAYVPLDPDYPEARLKYMLEDAQLTTVITQRHLCETTPVTDAQAVCLEDENIQQILQTQSIQNPSTIDIGLTSRHLVYVIYTSGSTGNPKGVMVAHHALVNRIDWMDSQYGSSPSDRILQKTPFSFDVSVWEFVWPLSVGAGIVLARPEGHKDPVYLSTLIRDQGVTKLHFVPSMLDSILSLGDLSQASLLRQVFCSGEALALHYVKAFHTICPQAKLHNLYGPTEAAIDVSYWDCSASHAGLDSVPIGRPINNIQLYVLNAQLIPSPENVAGELHIGGVGLARDYLNCPDLTAEKFIPNPFYDKNNPSSSERLYKTGDLVRWLPDGNLEFLGRIDHQVKIRGFRIELGEIENTLSTHADVKDAIVLAKESATTGDKRLVAYVVTDAIDLQDDSETTIAARHNLIETLRQHLNQTLPDYMVPSAFVLLAQLPLTPNGKVDRKALPEPDMSALQAAYVAPRTEVERQLCEIWQEVLGVDRVGITDNFFQLGGHSLLIMNVIARLQKAGLSMNVRQLFNASCLVELAEELERTGNKDAYRFTAPENLVPQHCKKILPEMLTLIDLDQESIDYIESKISGGAENIQEIYSLGPLQEGILYHHIMNECGDPYVNSSMFKFETEGALDAFILGLQYIVNRHDILRTAILWEGLLLPVQVVCRKATLKVKWIDLEPSQNAQGIITERCTPGTVRMDLGAAPLLQLEVAKDKNNEVCFVHLMAHHIVADHVGLEILQRELSLYQAGGIEQLPKPVAYREFIAHTKELSSKNDSKNYFTNILQKVNSPTAPLGLIKIDGNGSGTNLSRKEIQGNLSERLRKLAKNLKISQAAFFHTAWAIVISACSGKNDIVFGTVMSGRLQGVDGSENMIGVFINTLPLRVNLNSLSVREAVNKIQNSLFDLLPHEQASLGLIQKCSGLPADVPLFTSILNYKHSDIAMGKLKGVKMDWSLIHFHERTNYPLALSVDNFENGFALEIQVDNSVSADRILCYVQTALSGLIDALELSSETPIKEIGILPALEKQRLLIDWNQTTEDYPKDMCIHELFEAQAETNPNAIAVIFEEQKLTYSELNKKSNQLAHYLVNEKQVTPDTLVGICVERSLEMVVGILAILKAGGAYVPLDPEYPSARLEYMLSDSRVSTVITQSHLLSKVLIAKDVGVCLDDKLIEKELTLCSSENIRKSDIGLGSEHLAYVIYTSGSTGNPKGVMVEHSGLSNLTEAQRKALVIKPDSKILQFASISFDAATFDIFIALANGAASILIREEDRLNPDLLTEIINKNSVTHATLPPVLLSSLPIDQWSQVLTIVVAGDKVNLQTAQKWSENRHFINAYGPTETTICATMASINPDIKSIHIGKPIQNTQLYVLTESLDLAPHETSGELYIGGAGLARGYLNRPDLTKEKFIVNPFHDTKNPVSSERLYRTGDLVRWLSDGNLEYLGRIDHQVKIRGFRIELEEIEHALISYESVEEAIVLAKGTDEEKFLIGYVVPDKSINEKLFVSENQIIALIRSHLGKLLPEYMVPSVFMLLDKMPLTPNGKIDRNALPEPRISGSQEYVAPQTKMELLLSDIWQEVLGVERVGITDNFFQLGGHSLLIMQVIARLQKAGVSISVRQLFNAPRLVELAEELERMGNEGTERFIAPENLVQQRCKKLRPEMLTLINLDQASIDHIESKIPGGAENIQEIYSLGPLQEGILYHHMMSDAVDPYVLTLLFKVESKKVIDELVSGLQCIINRHDILRTAIVWDGLLSPVQVVCREVELPVEWIQFKSALDLTEGMEKYCLSGQHWINLTSAPLLELKIGHSEEADTYFAILLMHHIVADHVGIEIIQKEFLAYQTQTFEALPPSVPYREFIAHVQHQSLHNDAHAYFSALLNDLDEPTLPFNISEVNGNGLQFIEEVKQLSPELSSKIRSIANKLQVRAATLFHVVWSMVLSESSGKDDIVFGSVMSGRLQGTLGIENALGAFVNTLPLRVNLNSKSTLNFVKMANDLLTELMSYEYVSPGLIKNCSALDGSQPLITTIVNYRHTGIDEQSINDQLSGVQYILGQERTNYPFVFCIDDFGRDFSITLQVDRKISVKRVLGYVETALSGLIEALELSPEKSIKEIGILPALEKQQLLIDFNHTACEYPKDACIHELFELQVENDPDAIAIIFESEQLTYGELNQKANQLAHYLVIEKNIKPDDLVGVCVERSLGMVVGILAILKAGGAYVPLDPEYPEARLKYMLEDASLATVLTQSHLREATRINDEQSVCLDDEKIQQQLQRHSTQNLNKNELGLTSSHLAYVIYTSGSTGNPKGVMVEHTNVVNFLTGMRHKPSINVEDCLLAVTSTSFDIHGLELFLPLIVGAKLIVSSREATGNPELLFSLLKQHHVSLMQATPATWKMLLDSDGQFESPLKVLCGGEALSVHLATALLSRPQLELWNMYGPTETTIWSTTQQILPSSGQILMGQPIANTQIYIATNTMELAPVGVAGELLIGGAGVTRGYLNRPDLTAEKFIVNPFYDKNNPSSSERLYKTGDLVRWLPDGNLEFLGRIDHQVKIRGFRIELGEIENILSAHANVKDAVVVAKESVITGDKRLVAYVVTDAFDLQGDDESVIAARHELIESLRHHLGQTLPDYMVPSAFMLLERLPLTPNGKVDRKDLPEPDMANQQQEYIAPRTPTEKILCEIWQEILGVERVGVTDNFFKLGGHSLLAIKLVLEIEKKFNTSIQIKNLFTLDCLSSLSEHIDAVAFNLKPDCSINDMEFFEI